MWTRPALGLAVAALAVLALGGCADDGDDAATDPGGTTGGSPSASPTEAPTVGSYPEFEPRDYEYTLAVSCFCPDAGVPVRVSVRDGAVVEAVYDRKASGVDRGDPVPDHRALTINDIIEELNAATDAETVRVDWPDGQDHPSEVYIDRSARIADEEIGYAVSEVDVD